MSQDTDWWEQALAYVGENGATPANLSEMLEQQISLQTLQGDRQEIRIPVRFAKLIMEALKRTPQPKSAPRTSWRQHKLYDMLIQKGQRDVAELVAGGLKSSSAYRQVAADLHSIEELSHLSEGTIERDLQRADDGRPFRR